MTVDLPRFETVEETLPEYEPEKYWAVWQFPEGRYAYMIGYRREAWLIVMDSEEAGRSYLLNDARANGRSPSQYRLDELTLPDAFDAARVQPVPFVASTGSLVRRVLGVEIRTGGLFSATPTRRIPL